MGEGAGRDEREFEKAKDGKDIRLLRDINFKYSPEENK